MTAGKHVVQQQSVCPDGCCWATYDPTLGFDPQNPPEHAFYSRPMFQVMVDDGAFPHIGLDAMTVDADEYARAERIFL